MSMTPSQLDCLYQDSAVVQQAINKIQSKLGKQSRTLIGLTGGPGSGKSTLAEYLQSYVAKQNQGQVVSLSMDGFHLSKSQLTALPNADQAFARRGSPWTFDSFAFAKRIREIKRSYQQYNVLWPSFDHSIGDPIEDNICIPKDAKVVIVEGLYLLYQQDGWQEAGPLFDEHWFLDVPLALSLDRLTNRHMKAWNFSREQALERVNQNDGLNAELVLSTKDRADWLINIET